MVCTCAEKRRWKYPEKALKFEVDGWTQEKETEEHMEEKDERRDKENQFGRKQCLLQKKIAE